MEITMHIATKQEINKGKQINEKMQTMMVSMRTNLSDEV